MSVDTRFYKHVNGIQLGCTSNPSCVAQVFSVARVKCRIVLNCLVDIL